MIEVNEVWRRVISSVMVEQLVLNPSVQSLGVPRWEK